MATKQAESQKRLRQSRMRAGLCVGCGKVPPDSGVIRCAGCRKRHSNDNDKRHRLRKQAGLCYCGQLAVDGFASCEKHKDAAIKRHETRVVIAVANNQCRRCHGPISDESHCVECKKILSGRRKRSRKKIRDLVFAVYGGYRCSCCSETEELFLTIDHINNDGAAHRRSMVHGRQATGDRLYRWLRDNNFPPGFQVLCMSCNFGKQRNGGVCPHKAVSLSSNL